MTTTTTTSINISTYNRNADSNTVIAQLNAMVTDAMSTVYSSIMGLSTICGSTGIDPTSATRMEYENVITLIDWVKRQIGHNPILGLSHDIKHIVEQAEWWVKAVSTHWMDMVEQLTTDVNTANVKIDTTMDVIDSVEIGFVTTTDALNRIGQAILGRDVDATQMIDRDYELRSAKELTDIDPDDIFGAPTKAEDDQIERHYYDLDAGTSYVEGDPMLDI